MIKKIAFKDLLPIMDDMKKDGGVITKEYKNGIKRVEYAVL